MSDEPHVIVERRGRLGHLRLHRPRALNALDHGMVLAMITALREWADDPDVHTVVITGDGDRGLCAGGDIVTLYRDAIGGDGAASERFWADEYRLNVMIARYPKPYVAVMDGIVLGGGVGVSAHGSHRVVTERSRVGLPEVGIGFVPDIGATYLLSRAPGETGTHVALTGDPVAAGDAIALGLADELVPSDRIPSLLAALESQSADEALASHAQPAPPSALLAARAWIDDAYARPEVADIVAALRASAAPEAQAAADTIATRSPTALAATLESLRRARELPDLERVIAQEFRVSLAGLRAPDFAEGVRAQVIDKDRNPQWQPAGSVTRAEVAAWFAPLGNRELQL